MPRTTSWHEKWPPEVEEKLPPAQKGSVPLHFRHPWHNHARSVAAVGRQGDFPVWYFFCAHFIHGTRRACSYQQDSVSFDQAATRVWHHSARSLIHPPRAIRHMEHALHEQHACSATAANHQGALQWDWISSLQNSGVSNKSLVKFRRFKQIFGPSNKNIS